MHVHYQGKDSLNAGVTTMLDNSGMEIISIRISPWNGGMDGDKHPMLYFGQNRTVTQMDIGYERLLRNLDDGSISCWGRYSEYMFTNTNGIGSSGYQYTPLRFL